MTAIKRNLKYWGYSVEMLVLAVVGVTALLGVMQYLGDGLEEALDYLSDFMPMVCTITMCMLGFVGVGTYFPFSMTMGSTRKASFVGMQVMAHAMAAQIVLLTALINVVQGHLFSTERPSYTLVMYLSWVFLSTGICNVISAISIKCGRVWATIAYLLFAVVGGVGLSVVLDFADIEHISATINLILVMGTLVFDILMGIICFLAIKKYEVRV